MEVQIAYDELVESEHVVDLYISQLLPAARENLEAARSAYETGELDFLTLITAQRTLMDMQLTYYETTVAYQQRYADLERAAGQSLTTFSSEGGQER